MTAASAIIHLLKTLCIEPGMPISLYEIGVPLVGRGFAQDEIVESLFWLESDNVIKLLQNNCLRVVGLP